MKTLSYELRFTTPAFLGNAQQNGQWRTPPFKALLRQWWRVAFAAANGFPQNHAEMRRQEGILFGTAADASGNRSLVRLRLDKWALGTLNRWDAMPTVAHPEVTFPVDSGLYLGYGPVVLPRGQRQPALKANAAIQANEAASFSLAFPAEHAELMSNALLLIDRYGAVGGRSRNGWGSFVLTPLAGTPTLTGEPPIRPWRDALGIDWPHAIGSNGSEPLVWTTKAFPDWKQLMRELAIVKIGLRTQFMFPDAQPPHPSIEPRHWLSYPITTHTTRAWSRGARLPNSLRFKVRTSQNEPGKLIAAIFHVPCRPPAEFRPDPGAIERTWQAAHQLLDDLTNPPGARGYTSIIDEKRRAQLRTQLDLVTLARSPQ
jgi:CRISPR-associated protein Cmr1